MVDTVRSLRKRSKLYIYIYIYIYIYTLYMHVHIIILCGTQRDDAWSFLGIPFVYAGTRNTSSVVLCSVLLTFSILLQVHISKVSSLYISVRIAGGVGGLNPPTSSCRPPYLWSKFDPGGVEFQPPHLIFAEVGMLLPSHFLLMQFLKYLQCDDLNVTTILIHIED